MDLLEKSARSVMYGKFWKHKLKQFIISGKSAYGTAKVGDAKTKIQLNINYTYRF